MHRNLGVVGQPTCDLLQSDIFRLWTNRETAYRHWIITWAAVDAIVTLGVP
jgi:hypothetical protein